MADRWMDERDRRWRDRDWRRSEDYGRGDRDERRYAGGEDRSWGSSMEDDDGGYRGGERVFGERESGMSYGGEGYRGGMRAGGGAYGAGGSYGGGEGYGRYSGGGRGSAYRGGERGRGGWQNRDYQGVSPAMWQHEYDAERDAERYDRSHPMNRAGAGEGGRYYGDAGRERIYREEWSQGRRDYGAAPRGYDADRERDHRRGRFEEGYDTRFSGGGMASGGTGGYDYERGYGDAGRGRDSRDYGHEDRGDRWARGGYEAGDFMRRAGQRVASWFGGGRDEDERSRRDFRGMGPKGYSRPDERISDEVHERLTEDPYVDASNISASVSGGEVTLSGTVENREAKHRAERCVEDISGVKHVQNNLRVESGNPLTSAGRGYGDSVLEHQMRGETGAGENLSGNALAGSGSSAAGGGNGSSAGRTTSTSTDTGKSR